MVANADQDQALTIGEQLRKAGIQRRDFLEFCTKLMIAAPIGLAITKQAWAGEVAAELEKVESPDFWLDIDVQSGVQVPSMRAVRQQADV